MRKEIEFTVKEGDSLIILVNVFDQDGKEREYTLRVGEGKINIEGRDRMAIVPGALNRVTIVTID